MRQAIKATYGTNREFAKKLGVSEGRVSQLLVGAESITAQTLDQVLACFDNLGIQESLHQAWVRTFAPPPLERAQPDLAVEAEQLLASGPELRAAGQARPMLTQLRSLTDRLADDDLCCRVLLEAIDLALFLQRPSLAFSLARRLIERAEKTGEPGWKATGLYSIANTSRTVPSIRSRELINCHEEAVQFLGSWQAKSSQTRAYLRDALLRDRVLTLLGLNERQQLNPEELIAAERPLDEAIERAASASNLAHALEVKVRLLTASGRYFEAEEVLDAATDAKLAGASDYAVKTQIAEARIILARGDNEGARHRLEQTLQDCYDVDNLHHASIIERLLVGPSRR